VKVSLARKVDEAPSRPSGSPLRNTESTLTKIARRLSLTNTGNGKRRSIPGIQRAPLSLKDAPGVVATNIVAISGKPQTESTIVPTVPTEEVPKEIVIPCKIVTDSELEEERNKLIKDLGEDTAMIVIRVARDLEPKPVQGQVLDISTMSQTTMKFCGRSAPPVSLALYISRIIRNINNALDEDFADNLAKTVDSVGVRCLLLAVIFIERLKQKHPDFEINALNVHRLAFVAMTDALKMNEDEHPDNKYMALVGGVDTSQLNTLEAAFCTSSDFGFIVEMDQLKRVYQT